MKKQTTIQSLLILALVVLLGSNQNIAQNVGIGSESFTPDASAVLELQSTQQGFLPPRLTLQQRNAISNPATGLMIFNSTSDCLEIFIPAGGWQSIFCGCVPPQSPVAGTHVAAAEEIVWNWNVLPGITIYEYSTDNGVQYFQTSETSFTQSGLTCGTEYTLLVRAVEGNCASSPVTLTQSTSACCPALGDVYGGGKVIWKAGSGCSGIIATTSDLGGTYKFNNAVSACNGHEENGYDDWYLPDISQLKNQMCPNRLIVGNFYPDVNYYWSSSTNGTQDAWCSDLRYCTQLSSNKNGSFLVRCIRNFSIP